MKIIKIPDVESDWRLAVSGGVLWLLAISAPLVESDAYRYAVLALAVGALLTSSVVHHRKPDWLAWLCIGWAVYVAGRFLGIYLFTATHDRGSSEFLYIFPVFFPVLGLALWLYRAHVEPVLAVFFAVALLLLLVTTQYGLVIAGERASPLFHNNPIHGSIGSGMVMIGAFYWFMYYAEKGHLRSWLSRWAMVAAPLVIALCLFNIYGAKSKGVWLAVSFAVPFMCLSVLLYMNRKVGLIFAAIVAAAIIFAVYSVKDNLWQTAGPTITAFSAMLDHDLSGDYINNVLTDTIQSEATPPSMNQRLRLWSNALEVVTSAPVFGAGSSWLRLWQTTRYPDVGYDLLHNGYLEVAVRFGLFGLTIFAVMLAVFLHRAHKAYALGLISKSAFLCYVALIGFFLVTLLSNSNNRLAIGESFFLMVGAVAFYCTERLSRHSSGLRT
ncbi:MAG: O-antigen ligase family protein [Allorhizobium sp.]